MEVADLSEAPRGFNGGAIPVFDLFVRREQSESEPGQACRLYKPEGGPIGE